MYVFFPLAEVEGQLTTVKDERRMAKFVQYTMASTEEALVDAGWKPESVEEREATACIFATYIMAGNADRYREFV